jgi:hypothetical protein
MRIRDFAPIAAVLILACGGGSDPTSPGQRQPTLGRYAFTFESRPGTLGTYRDQGTLTITAADAEELEGSLTSTGANFGSQQGPYTAPFQSIGWNLDAYVVYASRPYGIYALRLTRASGDDLSCTARFLVNRVGAIESYVGRCTATYSGR